VPRSHFWRRQCSTASGSRHRIMPRLPTPPPAPHRVATQGTPRLALPLVGACRLPLNRDGQPGIVPGHLARGIPPSNILLSRPERPHLYDRHRGGKPWGMVIPPVEPDLVAWTKWCPHRMARVRRRERGPLLLMRACLLGVQCRSGSIGGRCRLCVGPQGLSRRLDGALPPSLEMSPSTGDRQREWTLWENADDPG
jgi:hypothetical protein